MRFFSRNRLVISLFLSFFIFSLAPHIVQAQDMIENASGHDPINGSTWSNLKSMGEDVVITGIQFEATNIPVGSSGDVCFYIKRTQGPILKEVIAVGSEIWCSHASRTGPSEDWKGNVDFSATPLFLPKNTYYTCGFSISNSPNTQYKCTFTYHKYQIGTPKYRSIRYSYVDRMSLSDGKVFPSYYYSTPAFPIKVRGFSYFQSFGGSDQADTTNNICLRWVKEGGTPVNTICAPSTSINPKVNSTNSIKIFPVNWDISMYDILTTTCDNSRSNTDCAIWAFIQIPDSFGTQAESIVGNFGLIKQAYLDLYCEKNVDVLNHYYFCGRPATCDNSTKIMNCKKLLSLAYPTSTPTPAPTTSSTIKYGDANNDSIIDYRDYQIWLSFYNQTVTNNSKPADFNQDNKINGYDYTLWLINFGK